MEPGCRFYLETGKEARAYWNLKQCDVCVYWCRSIKEWSSTDVKKNQLRIDTLYEEETRILYHIRHCNYYAIPSHAPNVNDLLITRCETCTQCIRNDVKIRANAFTNIRNVLYHTFHDIKNRVGWLPWDVVLHINAYVQNPTELIPIRICATRAQYAQHVTLCTREGVHAHP